MASEEMEPEVTEQEETEPEETETLEARRARWRQTNRLVVTRVAAKIISDHELTIRKITQEIKKKQTVYSFLLEYVEKFIYEEPAGIIGQIGSAAEGFTVDLHGRDMTAKRIERTTPFTVCGQSTAWLGPRWSGESIMNKLAACALMAEICDQLSVDVEYLNQTRPFILNIAKN
jgi:hypothetical protein